jgi:hypothetical protein
MTQIDYDPELILSTTAGKFQHEVKAALESVLQRKLWFNPPLQDQYRLLTLKVWVSRYHISLKEIFKVLLHAYAKRVASSRGGGLGISLRTLTGKKSKQIIEDHILRTYPSGENTIAWKSQEALRWLNISEEQEDIQDPFQYASVYLERIRRQRLASKNIIKKLSRRPFRNNPYR